MPGIEGIADFAGIPISDKPADRDSAIINVAGIISVFNEAGQTPDKTAHMASVGRIARIADGSFIVNIVQNDARGRIFRRIADNPTDIGRTRSLRAVFSDTSGQDVSQIVCVDDASVVRHADNPADTGVSGDMTGIIDRGDCGRFFSRLPGRPDRHGDDSAVLCKCRLSVFHKIENITFAPIVFGMRIGAIQFSDNTADIRRLGRRRDIRCVRIILRMDLTTIGRGIDMRERPAHVPDNTAGIPDNVIFFIIVTIILANNFREKYFIPGCIQITVHTARRDDFTAVILRIHDAKIFAHGRLLHRLPEVTRNPADIIRAADFRFVLGSFHVRFRIDDVVHIHVFGAPGNAADIATHIVFIVINGILPFRRIRRDNCSCDIALIFRF